MSACICSAYAAVEGSSALSPCESGLVLIEGGRAGRLAARAPRPARHADAGGLTLGQTVRALVCGGLVILAVVVASALVDPARAAGVQSALDELPTRSVIVSSGDSLWGIAAGCELDAPTDEVVTWIQERNGIEGGLVVPGQELVVPVAGAQG